VFIYNKIPGFLQSGIYYCQLNFLKPGSLDNIRHPLLLADSHDMHALAEGLDLLYNVGGNLNTGLHPVFLGYILHF